MHHEPYLAASPAARKRTREKSSPISATPGGLANPAVEVTENAIIHDLAITQEMFSSLQKAGIRIAPDDFRKGYSSLYHLRQLRFDQFKLDGSFVHSMASRS